MGGRASTAGSGTVHHREQRSRPKHPVAHPTRKTRGLQRQAPNTAPRDSNISRKRRAALPKPAHLIQPLTQQPARSPRTTHRHNNPIRTLRGNIPHAPALNILTQVPETFPPPIRAPTVRTIQNPRVPHTTIPREVHQPERPTQTPLSHQVGNYSRQQQRPNRVRRGHPHHANASAPHNHVPADPTTPPNFPAKVSKSPEPYTKCGQHRKRQRREVVERSTTRRPPSVAAHFSCYDGAVLGTIHQGVIAPTPTPTRTQPALAGQEGRKPIHPRPPTTPPVEGRPSPAPAPATGRSAPKGARPGHGDEWGGYKTCRVKIGAQNTRHP